VGTCGVSLGGYYAPRASAFEKRIKACIGLSGPYSLGRMGTAPGTLSRSLSGTQPVSTIDEARRHGETLSLGDGVAKQIECPLLLVAGKQDRLIDWRIDEACSRGERAATVIAVEDGNHVVNNRPYRYRHQIADWMAEQLGGEVA